MSRYCVLLSRRPVHGTGRVAALGNGSRFFYLAVVSHERLSSAARRTQATSAKAPIVKMETKAEAPRMSRTFHVVPLGSDTVAGGVPKRSRLPAAETA